MIDLPIYRAKKIDSDEYIEGYLVSNLVSNSNGMPPEVYYNIQNGLFYKYRIDPATLAIHLPSMMDIKGNKIFASLQDDGRGGDILFDMEYEFTIIFDDLKFRLEGLECNTKISEYDKFTDFEVIGIQQ